MPGKTEDNIPPVVEIEVNTNTPIETETPAENIETEIKDAIEENKIEELIQDIKQEAIEAAIKADEAQQAAEEIIERNKIEAQDQVTKYIQENEEWKIHIAQTLMNLSEKLEALTLSTPMTPPVESIPMEPQNENVGAQLEEQVEEVQQNPAEKLATKIKAKIRAI